MLPHIGTYMDHQEKTQRKPYEGIGFILLDGSLATGFSRVECQYVSVADVVLAYTGRRKFADQSWLTALHKEEPMLEQTGAAP